MNALEVQVRFLLSQTLFSGVGRGFFKKGIDRLTGFGY